MNSKLRNKLYYNETVKGVPKSFQNNKFIDNIVKDENIFLNNKELYNNLQTYRKMGFLKKY